MGNEKVVLLDFCETVVKFQTADRFVDFICHSRPSLKLRIEILIYKLACCLWVIRILNRLFPRSSINKRFILYRLRGLPKQYILEKAEEYYNVELKPNFIKSTIDKITELQESGYRIIILSGGYDVYLRFFAREFHIDDIISTRVRFKLNKCLGEIEGIDCLWENKVKLLKEYTSRNSISINNNESIAITDSISDLPMLQFVGNHIIVHRSNNKNEWYKQFNYNNLILW